MLIGVDAGGTSTRAVVLGETGRCLGFGAAGGGNPVSWGPDRALAAIRDAIVAAARAAGFDAANGDDEGRVPGRRAGEVVLAMAGGRGFIAPEAIADALAREGISCSVAIESDLLATFCAGTAELSGYGLVAGTGSAAIRVEGGRVSATADGLGWLIGDSGSGFWIGRRVVRASLAAVESRGADTLLAAMLLDELGIGDRAVRTADGRLKSLQALVDILYRDRPVELSRFAALAFRAAGAGDAVAAAILADARDRLARTLRAVHRDEVSGPIVIGGGVARRLPGLAEALGTVAPRASGHEDAGAAPVVLVQDGAVGAGVLALRRNGVAVDESVFRQLVTTLAERRAACPA